MTLIIHKYVTNNKNDKNYLNFWIIISQESCSSNFLLEIEIPFLTGGIQNLMIFISFNNQQIFLQKLKIFFKKS